MNSYLSTRISIEFLSESHPGFVSEDTWGLTLREGKLPVTLEKHGLLAFSAFLIGYYLPDDQFVWSIDQE